MKKYSSYACNKQNGKMGFSWFSSQIYHKTATIADIYLCPLEYLVTLLSDSYEQIFHLVSVSNDHSFTISVSVLYSANEIDIFHFSAMPM